MSKFHVVDISDQIKKAVPPTWLIAQRSEHFGRDLRALENAIAAELGITWPQAFGDEMQGVYEKEEDCARVATEMMRRQPELRLWVTCSDPEWRPAYSPIANIITTVRIDFG